MNVLSLRVVFLSMALATVPVVVVSCGSEESGGEAERAARCQRLIDALRDRENRTRFAAALSDLSVSIPDCAEQVSAVLRLGDPQLATDVAACLTGVKPLPPCTVQPLLDRLRETTNEAFVYAATRALAEQDSATVIRSRDAVLKCVSKGMMLGSLPLLVRRLGDGILPDLLPMLKHEESRVRSAALAAIGECGGRSQDAVRCVQDLTGDEEFGVRVAAVSLLAQWGVHRPLQLSRLGAWLREAPAPEKHVVIRGVAQLGPIASNMRKALQSVHDRTDDPVLREEVLSALRKIGAE